MPTDLGAAVGTLPPDTRGGRVEVPGGRFAARDHRLSYDEVLVCERAARPTPAVMQLILAGDGALGTETTVPLEPVPLTIAAHDIVGGSVLLPAGPSVRQATVRILDRAGGNQLCMRVLHVR